MRWLVRLGQTYDESRRNKWFRYFVVFCRIALALGFIPSGIVKLRGERFTGLPANHPLGHYFDALFLTGYYYTFIGAGQLTAAVLLLIPGTALLGAILYFPIIVNITVLAYATRFEGTRITAMMLLANLFLLVWDYDRLKHVLPFTRTADPALDESATFPVWFFGLVVAAVAAIVVGNIFLYDIRPGNSRLECTNGCKFSGGNPTACLAFCDCIYTDGNPLNACVAGYETAKDGK